MTARYHCPISACGWFHDAAGDLNPLVTCPDPVCWTPVTWAALSERPATGLATAHVVDAHLVTHSPVEWMTEMARLQRRIKSLEQLCGDLSAAVQLPSRAEVEATGIPPQRHSFRDEVERFLTPEGRRVVAKFVAANNDGDDDFDVREVLNRNLDQAVLGMVAGECGANLQSTNNIA